MTVTAYCPGHISGYFKRIPGDTPEQTGSIGAGIVIDPGVAVMVSRAPETTITIRRILSKTDIETVADRSPPLESALERIDVTASVYTVCSLPIGAGFGLSAAALLATLTAVNRMEDLGMDAHEIARIAHDTEVQHRTGLGDVSACQAGGRVVRTSAGIDGEIGRLFDMPEPLYAVSFGPIPTPSVLGSPEQMARVARAFPDEIPKSRDHFFTLCRAFAEKSGLVTGEVEKVLQACTAQEIPASMTMLGNGVFAYGEKARPVLEQFGPVYRCAMAKSGACITEDFL